MSDLPETQSAPSSVNEVIAETPNDASSTSDNVNPQLALLNMEIADQNSALNCLIGYIGLAQRKGAFAIDESSKIYECIKMFQSGQ